MHEFDEYIDSIIDDLRVSERKKNDMNDEYRDHLEMLKKDYIQDGLSDEDAVKEAIKSFGDSSALKVKLTKNMPDCRSIPNILFGIFFAILIFVVGRSIPVPGLLFEEGHITVYGITNDIISYSIIYLTLIMAYILMFIPVGYFLPIIFKRAGKMKNTALASLLLSLIIGIGINWGHFQAGFIISNGLGGFLGGIFGFTILRGISKVSLSFSYSR